MEINLVQQYPEESKDAYFLLKLRAIKHNFPICKEEVKVHYLSMGLQRSFLKRVALETYNTVQDLQTKLQALEKSQELTRKKNM